MELAANIIWVIHIAFILWYIITPFTNNIPMLTLHFFTGPMLWIHWVTMRDECSLTLLEMKLRGIDDCKESFFWNLVSPIYKPRTDETVRQIIWLLSILLWFVTLSKVLKRPEMIAEVFYAATIPFRKTVEKPPTMTL